MNITSSEVNAEFKHFCKQFSDDLSRYFSWEWDQRFDTVMADFEVSDMTRVLTSIKPYFNKSWDHESIHSAPDYIQNNCHRFGRMRTNQVFAATDTNDHILMYCLIMPWNDGSRISIRIAPYSMNTAYNPDVIQQQFKNWFGV